MQKSVGGLHTETIYTKVNRIDVRDLESTTILWQKIVSLSPELVLDSPDLADTFFSTFQSNADLQDTNNLSARKRVKCSC